MYVCLDLFLFCPFRYSSQSTAQPHRLFNLYCLFLNITQDNAILFAVRSIELFLLMFILFYFFLGEKYMFANMSVWMRAF